MPLVTPTPIAALPTPPSTSSPSDFDAKADAFLGGLPDFQAQANQLATDTNTNADWAAQQASTASTQASIATTRAEEAAASAITASQSGSAAKWSGATSYAEGACVWSPVDYQTYRKISAGTSTTTEPTGSPTIWRAIVPQNHLTLLALGIR